MRLIDADALIDEIDGVYQRHYVNSAYQFIHDFFRAVFRRIHKAPTVEATPVVHGRWAEDLEDIICSECGCSWNLTDNCTETFNYCPNCGAKMDGG